MDKKHSAWVIVFVLAFTFILFSCSRQAPGQSSPAAAVPSSVDKSVPAGGVKTGAELEWETMVKEGKKEGVVVIHADAQPDLNSAVAAAFKGKYGINLEFVTGRSAETNQKLLTERRAGLFMADLYQRGTTAGLALLKPNGVLDPLEPVLKLPEVINPKNWYGDVLPWADHDHYMISFLAFPSGKVGLNTDMVREGEIKAYRDLLDPRWKGKISMNDPTVSGSGYRWFHTTARYILNMDFMRSLAKQEPVILRDQRVQVEWIVQGKYPVSISPNEATVTQFLAVGKVPLAIINPSEGGYLTTGSGAISLMNKAPHPNAAKLFVNWLLTQEGQTVFSKAYGAQSARVDVPTDFLNAWSKRESGVKYINVMAEDFDAKSQEYLDLAKETFGFLMK